MDQLKKVEFYPSDMRWKGSIRRKTSTESKIHPCLTLCWFILIIEEVKISNTGIFVVLLVTATSIGFAAGTRFTNVNNIPALSNPKSNELLASQQATFQGKINQVSGDKLQITSTQDKTGTITLSKDLRIYPLNKDNTTASASADLKDIVLDKPVIITLVLIDSEYQAASLTYLPVINP